MKKCIICGKGTDLIVNGRSVCSRCYKQSTIDIGNGIVSRKVYRKDVYRNGGYTYYHYIRLNNKLVKVKRTGPKSWVVI